MTVGAGVGVGACAACAACVRTPPPLGPQFFGDLLAKNAFVALGCVVKGQYLKGQYLRAVSPHLTSGAVIASPAQLSQGRFYHGGGEGADDAMQSAQGAC